MPIIEHLEFSKCAMGFFEWMALERQTQILVLPSTFQRLLH